MATETQTSDASSAGSAAEPVVHVLWINAGLGCDGDSVSLTAATQPSIEDIVMGALPGLPKVALHWPLIDFDCGQSGATTSWSGGTRPTRGELEPFVLVVEGSIPNEEIKSEGYWAASGTTRRPASRSPPANGSTGSRPRRWPSWPPAPAPPTAASTPWPATPPAPWAWPTTWAGTGGRRPGIPIVNVPGCPVQPDNMTETLLYLLYQVAGLAPMIPLDEELRPTWLFGKTVHEGCDRGRLLRAGRFRHTNTARRSAW